MSLQKKQSQRAHPHFIRWKFLLCVVDQCTTFDMWVRGCVHMLAYCYTLLGHRVPISIRFWRADSLMGPLNGTFLGEGAQSIPGTIRIILIPNTQMSQFCPVTAPWFHNQFLNFELTRNLSWSWCIFCPFKDCLKSISLDKDCLKTKRLDTHV